MSQPIRSTDVEKIVRNLKHLHGLIQKLDTRCGNLETYTASEHHEFRRECGQLCVGQRELLNKIDFVHDVVNKVACDFSARLETIEHGDDGKRLKIELVPESADYTVKRHIDELERKVELKFGELNAKTVDAQRSFRSQIDQLKESHNEMRKGFDESKRSTDRQHQQMEVMERSFREHMSRLTEAQGTRFEEFEKGMKRKFEEMNGETVLAGDRRYEEINAKNGRTRDRLHELVANQHELIETMGRTFHGRMNQLKAEQERMHGEMKALENCMKDLQQRMQSSTSRGSSASSASSASILVSAIHDDDVESTVRTNMHETIPLPVVLREAYDLGSTKWSQVKMKDPDTGNIIYLKSFLRKRNMLLSPENLVYVKNQGYSIPGEHVPEFLRLLKATAPELSLGSKMFTFVPKDS